MRRPALGSCAWRLSRLAVLCFVPMTGLAGEPAQSGPTAGVAWAEDLCLEMLPSAPEDRSPTTSIADNLTRFRSGSLPQALIPLKFIRTGRLRPRGKWYDPRGEVYRFVDVESALLADPASADRYRAFRTHQSDSEEFSSAVVFHTVGAAASLIAVNPSTGGSGEGVVQNAKAAAASARDRARARAGKKPAFHSAICAFNMAQQRRAQAPPSGVEAAKKGADRGIPMAAFSFSRDVYEAMGREAPEDDEERWADEVAVIWGWVDAGRSPDEVVAAASRGAALAGPEAGVSEVLRRGFGEP